MLLHRFPHNFNRKDTQKKLALRVWIGGRSAFHLTLGTSLRALHQKAQGFARGNPELCCKPLFFFRHQDLDYFGQEYFGEGNLDEAFARRQIDVATWQEGVIYVKKRLAATSKPSSYPLLLKELAGMERRLLAMEWFGHFDCVFIRDALFPLIRNEVMGLPPVVTWTNGDFVAKNILFDGRGGFRLIDYEFAGKTHFSGVDWFRLQHFSIIPGGVDMAKVSGTCEWPKWLEIVAWLEHAIRLNETCLTSYVGEDLQIVADHLARLYSAASPTARRSIFVSALAGGMSKDSDQATNPSVASLLVEWSRTGSLKSMASSSQPLRTQAWNELRFHSILHLDAVFSSGSAHPSRRP